MGKSSEVYVSISDWLQNNGVYEVITPLTPIRNLPLDSLDMVELIMAIEDSCHVRVSDADAEEMLRGNHTIQDMCDRIERLQNPPPIEPPPAPIPKNFNARKKQLEKDILKLIKAFEKETDTHVLNATVLPHPASSVGHYARSVEVGTYETPCMSTVPFTGERCAKPSGHKGPHSIEKEG